MFHIKKIDSKEPIEIYGKDKEAIISQFNYKMTR